MTHQAPLETVAFIGLGTMGNLMCARLLAAGYPVRAFDLSAEALERAAGRGAQPTASPADAVAGAAVAVLSLPSPAVVEEVVTGDQGLLAGLAPGSVVIDMSTIDPTTARRLHERVAAQGSSFLDAPVSGSVWRAEDGTLTIMVGGDEQPLERSRPLLEHLGSNVLHVGPSGSGQVAKLCNNMLLAITVAGIAETFVTAAKAGMDARTLHEVVRISSGSNWVVENWLTETTLADDYAPRFSLDLLHKDVSLFARTADDAAVSVPIAAATEEMLKAARSRGLGPRDMTAVVQMYEELAGARVLKGERQGTEPA